MNRSLMSLEADLVQISDDALDGFEDEGPQNRDIRLAAAAAEESELLTKMVPVSEVSSDISAWRSAMLDEATSLISEYKACRPITKEAVKKLESRADYEVVRVPGKIVASIKPPNRKKVLLVACGNYLVRNKTKGSPALDRKDVYCANMDTFSLRAQLTIGGLRKWTASSSDVRTAFLTAPLQPERNSSKKKKLIVVRAPRVMVQAGSFEANTWLLVQGALYGLRESPHIWRVGRNAKLEKLQWEGSSGDTLVLTQCESDVSLWCVRDAKSREIRGCVGVYVDDLRLMTEEKEMGPLIRAIRAVWKCSDEPSHATTPGGFTFCGVQIEQVGTDLWIHQMKYIGDLKQRYEHIRPTTQLPELKSEPAEEVPDPEAIQYAQRVIGELTWVACRTRLDIACSVNRLSRRAISYPRFAAECGEQILGYVFHTMEVKLRYGECKKAAATFEDEPPTHIFWKCGQTRALHKQTQRVKVAS